MRLARVVRCFASIAILATIVNVCEGANAQRIGLGNLAGNRNVRFGSAVNIPYLRENRDNVYAKFAADELNMIEPENDFKPPAIWRGENQYS